MINCCNDVCPSYFKGNAHNCENWREHVHCGFKWDVEETTAELVQRIFKEWDKEAEEKKKRLEEVKPKHPMAVVAEVQKTSDWLNIFFDDIVEKNPVTKVILESLEMSRHPILDSLLDDSRAMAGDSCDPMAGPEEVPGGSCPSQYRLPEGAEELQDLIEYRNMNFAVATVFKACYRMNNCEHSDAVRDLNKILWFGKRELDRIQGVPECAND